MHNPDQHASTDAITKPWWREPWPWILMAGPALTMVGCIITILLAVYSYGDQAVDDGGVKRGLVVSKPVQAQSSTSQPQSQSMKDKAVP